MNDISLFLNNKYGSISCFQIRGHNKITKLQILKIDRIIETTIRTVIYNNTYNQIENE